MEYEQHKPFLTVKELLGSSRKPDEAEIGIIKETEHWIHLKAFDYLMVGFVTDVDQVEDAHEQRYKAYVDTIEATFAEYREDVKKWDENHLSNIEPNLWQKQHDYEHDNEIRRIDLPSIEVCRDSIVGPAARRIPTRDEIEHVASEGLNKFYDRALEASRTLLIEQLNEIEAELPVAPYESIEKGVKTQAELTGELKRIQSRLSMIQELSVSRTIVESNIETNVNANISDLNNYDFKPTMEDRHSLTDELRKIAGPLRRVGGAVLQLVNTGQIFIKKTAP